MKFILNHFKIYCKTKKIAVSHPHNSIYIAFMDFSSQNHITENQGIKHNIIHAIDLPA